MLMAINEYMKLVTELCHDFLQPFFSRKTINSWQKKKKTISFLSHCLHLKGHKLHQLGPFWLHADDSFSTTLFYFTLLRASPLVLSMWNLPKYFSHPSLVIYFFFATPRI